MARSALFQALRRITKKHGADASSEARGGWSRRDMLRALGAAATLPMLSACGDNVFTRTPTIAIVGGGIAGLTAAHFLAHAGVRADVYEGSMRTGGRMYTHRGLPGDQLVELGGELIDSDHVVVPLLAASFGLTLDDLVEDTAALVQDTFHFNGAVIPEATIVAQFAPVAAKMQLALAASEGTDASSVAEFERIDAMSIPEWLAEANASPLVKELLEVAYLEEYGLEVSEQSAWNLLFLIDSANVTPFRVFGDSDERYHIHEGNDALTTALAEGIGDALHLDHRLTKVMAVGPDDAVQFELTFDNGRSVIADHVVYAIPFTKLREVDLDAANLSDDKREVIDELGYGTNSKLMLQFRDRHWESLGSGGGVITDVGNLQTIWATSRGQPGVQGILTNFVGGTRGITIGEGTAESQAQLVLPQINTIFPGIAAKYIPNSAIRQHWPSYEYAKGSYGCYRIGQWRFFGTEGVREGNQHFCGEHCSEDFQGYMEGAAETGAMVAAEILDDLGSALPPQLASVLSMVAARPRASYHGSYHRRMKLSDIRRR